MLKSKPERSPMDPGYDQLPHDARLNDEGGSRYRSIVGTLLYLTVKKIPDLAVTASRLGSGVASPKNSNMNAVKSASRYRQGTNHGRFIYAPVLILT